MRNQRLKAPQEIHRLKSGGYGPGCSAHPHQPVRGTPWSVCVAGREAVVNVCGVATAMLQGHSWVPIPSNGRKVNVGTCDTRAHEMSECIEEVRLMPEV